MNSRQVLDWDTRWTEKLRMQPGQRFWKLAAFLAHSGDSWFWLAGLFIIWLATRGEWHIRAALLAMGVFGLAVVVMAIKFTVKRRRPEGEWGAIYRTTDPHSFPSGHAARAALLAVMAVMLGPAWFAILVVLWAPLVCLARVCTGMHYVIDVIAGAALGFVAGWVVLALVPVFFTWFPFLF